MSQFPGVIHRQKVAAPASSREPSPYQAYTGSVAGQAHPKDGQALPMAATPAPGVGGWGIGPAMQQWGPGQMFYPANH